MTLLNAFYNVVSELVLTLAMSGAGSALPQLFPAGCAVGFLFGSGFVRSCRAAGFYRFPGLSHDGERAPRKCTTSQKQHQKQTGSNWEFPKKVAEI